MYVSLSSYLTTLVVLFFLACLYSHNIVSSLNELTEFAKKINSQDPQALVKLTSSDDFFGKKHDNTNQIGKLVEAFKSLVDGLTNLKHGKKVDLERKRINHLRYPKNQFSIAKNKFAAKFRSEIQLIKKKQM